MIYILHLLYFDLYKSAKIKEKGEYLAFKTMVNYVKYLSLMVNNNYLYLTSFRFIDNH